MSRSTRHVAARLAAVIFAGLLAAPAAIAAPRDAVSVPRVSTSAVAPGVRTPSKNGPTVHKRGHINVTAEASKPHPARPQVLRPRGNVGNPPKTTVRRGPTVASRAPATPTLTTNPPIATPTPIPGFSFGSSNTNSEPPDPWIAVGPDHVVQSVNFAFRFKRRQGEAAGANSGADVPTAVFFQLAPPVPGIDSGNGDARITYDTLHGRWLASEFSYDCEPFAADVDGPAASFGRGYVDFAISDNADPTLGWTSYYVAFSDAMPDYPAMGTSTDKVVFASNVFPFTDAACHSPALAGVEIDVVDWSTLIAGLGKTDIGGFANDNGVDPSALATPRAAIQVPATSPTVHGVVELANGSAWDVAYFHITGTVAGKNLQMEANPPDLTTTGSLMSAFASPPDPNQPGSTNPTLVAAVDERPTDAIWQGNRLVFVSTTSCTPSGDTVARDCVRVAELNTTSVTAPTVRQDFVLSEVGKDYFFGGVGLSLNGSLHVTYSRSSATAGDFISSYGVYQLPTDAPNAVSPAELLLAGTSEYKPTGPTGFGERWGDYLGVAADPQAPGAVWAIGEAAGGTGFGWTTNARQLNTDAGSTYVPIAPTRVLDTRINLGLSGTFHSNVARIIPITGAILNFGAPSPIPANAIAITGNVTPVNQTSAGFVSITPRPVNKPSTSTDNFPLGDTRANNVTVTLGPNGAIAATYAAATSGKTTHLVFDVTGYFLPEATDAMYHPVTPARLLDTRPGAGNVGGYTTPFSHAVPRSFPVWGQANIPITATAVTGNITVVNQSAPGFATIGPASVATPSTSNLNFKFGDVRANGVTVKLSDLGALWLVFNSSNTSARANLLFDVTGYYAPAAIPGGLKYFPLSPGRILDTRPNTVLTGLRGAQAGTTTAAKVTRTLDTAGHQGVPLAAQAVTGNLTVVSPTKTGFISILKASTDALTSTLNFPVGDVRANGITVPLNGTGDMLLLYATASGGTVHMLLDITGYFR